MPIIRPDLETAVVAQDLPQIPCDRKGPIAPAPGVPFDQYCRVAGFAAFFRNRMKQSEQKSRRRLTGLEADPTLALPHRWQVRFAGEGKTATGIRSNDLRIHSRDVHVSQLLRRNAGVFTGLITKANSGSRQPTRHEARWVFAFAADLLIPNPIERFMKAE